MSQTGQVNEISYTTPTLNPGTPWVKRYELFAGLDALNEEVEEVMNTWRENGDDAPATFDITDLMERLAENTDGADEPLENQFAILQQRVAELVALHGSNFDVALFWN